MPGRTHPLITGNIYHVYNKSIEKKAIFIGRFCNDFLNTAAYYRSSQSILRYSNFQKLSPIFKKMYEKKIFDKSNFRVTILAYCLMPTHYHILMRQNQDKGISFFMSQLQNSFTRFYNLKTQRIGPLFLEKFKSKPIMSEEVLKHVSRYIHLNPYSSGDIQEIENIKNYPYSSFSEYVGLNADLLCNTDVVLSLFNGNRKKYEEFVLNNAEYQKTLEYCKYSSKW